MAPLPGAGDDLSIWPAYSKGLPCSSESHGVFWEGKVGQSPRTGAESRRCLRNCQGLPVLYGKSQALHV